MRSGRLFPEHAVAGAPLACTVAPPAALRTRAIWATHGAADGTTPVSLGRDSLQLAATLFAADADPAAADAFAQRVSFQPHSGGHEIPGAALRAAAAALLKWNAC